MKFELGIKSQVRYRFSMLVSIIIPVFNEAPSVLTLLNKVWNQPLPEPLEKELVIIESNSSDGTRDLVKQFIAEKTAAGLGDFFQVIYEEAPRGKGCAVRKGLQTARGDFILIQDGDLEYDVADYPALLTPLMENKTSLVIGSRHLSAGNWKIRKFEQNPIKAAILNLGGVFFHGFFNFMFWQHLTDPTSMYKVFRKSCIKDLYFNCNRFDFDYELLGKILRAGYKPMEIPISYQSRSFAEGKKINVFRDPWMWVWAIMKTRFGQLHEGKKYAVTVPGLIPQERNGAHKEL
jgi:glycosyltransferase involved in cell wall biosynthesis